MQEAGRRRTVHYLVIDGQRQADVRHEGHILSRLHRLEIDVADAQNAYLGRVEHGREGLDPQAAQVGHGEGAAGQFVRGNATIEAGCCQPLGLAGDLPQAELAGIADHGNHQPARRIHGHTKLHSAVASQRVALEMRVQVGVQWQRACNSQQDQVVDRDALQGKRLGAGLEAGPQSLQRAGIGRRVERQLRRGLHRSQHPFRNDFAHACNLHHLCFQNCCLNRFP